MLQESTTIYEVARQAKVSPVTVSRAFSGQAPVAEKTRQRVFAVAAQLGYEPSPFARAMRGAPTQSIGVLWSLGGSPEAAMIVRDMAMAAQQHGYVTYAVDSRGDAEAARRQALADCRRRRVDAVVLQQGAGAPLDTSGLADLLGRFGAVVLVQEEPADGLMDVVIHDRRPIYREIAHRLVDAGRQRVAFIGEAKSNQSKTVPLYEVLRARGQEDDERLRIPLTRAQSGARLTAKDYAAALTSALDRGVRFDALVCGNDAGATAALACLRQRGLRVPQDIAVIGCDNIETSAFTDPPLATIDPRGSEVASAVVRLLFGRLKNPDLPPQREAVAMRFITRASAGL